MLSRTFRCCRSPKGYLRGQPKKQNRSPPRIKSPKHAEVATNPGLHLLGQHVSSTCFHRARRLSALPGSTLATRRASARVCLPTRTRAGCVALPQRVATPPLCAAHAASAGCLPHAPSAASGRWRRGMLMQEPISRESRRDLSSCRRSAVGMFHCRRQAAMRLAGTPCMMHILAGERARRPRTYILCTL